MCMHAWTDTYYPLQASLFLACFLPAFLPCSIPVPGIRVVLQKKQQKKKSLVNGERRHICREFYWHKYNHHEQKQDTNLAYSEPSGRIHTSENFCNCVQSDTYLPNSISCAASSSHIPYFYFGLAKHTDKKK